MEGAERDSTQDWLVPAGAAPPLLSELELKVDAALAIAKASEAGVSAVGEAALDAARQARRAAELAESASAVALEASRAVHAAPPVEAAPSPPLEPEGAPGAGAPPAPELEPAASAGPDLDGGLLRFTERADRVSARLRALTGSFGG